MRTARAARRTVRMKPLHPGGKAPGKDPDTAPGLPWHWFFRAAALLLGAMGAWTLWGRMPIAQPMPPVHEVFQLRQVANAADLKLLQHRQVFLRGRFTGHAVALEGRDMAGRSGFYVLAPFLEKGASYVDKSETGMAVLVLRGWVPSGTRNLEQILLIERHDVLIEGRLAIPSLGDAREAAAEKGFTRRNLSVEAYGREIGVPLLAMVVLQQPGADWSEQDIRQDFYRRRWPELYPQDRHIARNGWAMLVAAIALAALGLRARGRRR